MEAFAVWLTGLPASGKSAIAAVLYERLRARGITVEVLESDEVRRLVTPTPTYDPHERELLYRAIAFAGSRLVAYGVSVIFDATATKRHYRDAGRTWIPRFLEVGIECPLAVCIARDPKGIYRRGLAGELTNVPGLHDPYEPPLNPEVRIPADRMPPEPAAVQIINALEDRGWLPPGT